MKIKYLGTAAYEGIPSMFCSCRVCKRAAELGGRELRSRSQALINGELLLDFGPDTVWHSQRYHLDWSRIHDCLITHSHSDHLYPEDALMLTEPYSHGTGSLRFYAAGFGYRRLTEIFPSAAQGGRKEQHQAEHPAAVEPRQPDFPVSLEQIRPGIRFRAGGGAYEVLPLWASHDPSTDPVIYSISGGGKRLLYAHDTGVFCEDTWEGLRSEGRYDLISLDCTGAMNDRDREHHMCLKTNREMLEQMRQEGLVDQNTVVVVNHFSHNGGATYEELCREAEKDGLLVAYDGMEVEV